MPQLLLELFSEEIPARMQAGAARELARMAAERLKVQELTYDALRTFAGPRRLTLVVDGLPAATPDRSEELKGPKASAPPQALEGFLRKAGVAREALVERDGVLFATLNRPGRPTPEIAAEVIRDIVWDFPWPKSMRSGTSDFRWVRPLKRVLFLFNGNVVPWVMDGIESDEVTEGHRFMGPRPGGTFPVRNFDDYAVKLQEHYVVLDAAERRRRIAEGAAAACEAEGLEVVPDEGLLEEVAGLAEWPTPVLGRMDPAFLDLPGEVIRTSMRTHQKYFAVRKPGETALQPRFVVVANVEASDGGAALAAGNARVLSARLNDARFFWDEDRKPGAFEKWAGKLTGVTFHAKLGTLAERVERIAALAREIAPAVGADPDQAERAARLSKLDLASAMVGEFPELQGVMGGYYARVAGEPDAVADAVRDHYKPVGPSDGVPREPVTVAVALADKLDTLVGFFAIDEKPTGSKDPYALRRAALGVIRLVLENGARLPLLDILYVAERRYWQLVTERADWKERATNLLDYMREVLTLSGYPQFKRPVQTPLTFEQRMYNDIASAKYVSYWLAVLDLLAFFADRLKVQLRDEGRRHDLVDAVFALGDDDLVRITARVEALSAFLATDDGANLLAGYKRAVNILRAEAKKNPDERVEGAVDSARLVAPEEQALGHTLAAVSADLERELAAEDWTLAMRSLARLRAPVDAFFDRVLVNDPDPAVRLNRLRLLSTIRDAANRVADFSLIQG